MKKILLSAVAAAAALSFSQAALAGAVLDKVKKA